MRSIAYALPALPGFAGPKTYAAWPVWRDSTTVDPKYQPMPKRQAVRLWHKARRFERQTRRPGRQDGAIGRNGLAVLQALLFDFLNYSSGRLDPSQAKIAEKACISARSVARGLVSLRAAGVLNWIRRCTQSWRDGRFCLEQDSNAYAVLPPSQWCGFYEPPEAPSPHPSSWGATPPLPPATELAASDLAAGSSREAAIAVLESDPGDKLAAALARLGRVIIGPTH
ncbi:MAG TPA: hypothetical protein VGG11_14600 [Xanthobacteraceae bacterium]|jgi:hypothetical protein